MTEQEKRKKIIKGLECCSAEDKRLSFCYEYDCPYRDYEECPMNLMRDALNLLKEQESVAVKWFTFKDDITDEEYKIPFCSACEYNVTDANFCPNCGKRVKWD